MNPMVYPSIVPEELPFVVVVGGIETVTLTILDKLEFPVELYAITA